MVHVLCIGGGGGGGEGNPYGILDQMFPLNCIYANLMEFLMAMKAENFNEREEGKLW